MSDDDNNEIAWLKTHLKRAHERIAELEQSLNWNEESRAINARRAAIEIYANTTGSLPIDPRDSEKLNSIATYMLNSIATYILKGSS